MTKAPRDWCDPHDAFGQIYAKPKQLKKRVKRCEWQPPEPHDLEGMVAFRAAVRQSVICLYVRTAKNKKPQLNKRGSGEGVNLEWLASKDPLRQSLKSWEAKMTGQRPFTNQDLVALDVILPGCMPPQSVVDQFIAVAEKRQPSVPGWPDTLVA